MSSFSPQQLEQYVQECLSHLYDFAFLQNHPLVDILIQESIGPNRIQAFRALILSSIESIRSEPELVLHHKPERYYGILNLRYIKKHPVQRVLSILAVSERQFYRDHAKAIQIVTSILWEQVRGGESVSIRFEREEAGSLASEVQRARAESKQTTMDYKTVIEGIITVLQTLLDENRIHIDIAISDEITLLNSDHTAVRQIILLILSELVMNAPFSQITISCEKIDSRCQTIFRQRLAHCDDATFLQVTRNIDRHESLQQLVQSVQGQVTSVLGQSTLEILLDIPERHETILVVDDNPNIIRLFQRYAGNLPYQVVGADSYELAIRCARTLNPRLIILDVMLPGQDGWEILQNLKSHPKTSVIPVMVCSVLHVASLAMSLGADAFLKKPPGQEEFIHLLEQQ